MENKFTIKFSPHIDFEKETIEIEEFNQMTNTLTRYILNTREDIVRRALIQLGWKPPIKDHELK